MTLRKICVLGLVLAMFVGIMGPGMASADEVSDLQAELAALMATLDGLNAQLAALTGGEAAGVCPCTFTQNLYPGVRGDEVKCLQEYLNDTGYTLAASGAGSAGSETTYFGSLTRAAVKAWQDANGVSYGEWWGYFGPVSQAAYDELCEAEPPAPVVVCADYETEEDCPANCYWYDEACNAAEKPAEDYETEADCEAADFYWYDEACNEDEYEEGPLAGGAGSVANYRLVSGIANEEVGEGEADVAVAGLEIRADDGSDLKFTAVQLTFNEGTAGSDFKDYADEVSVWLGDEELARVDGNTFTDDNNWIRTLTLSGNNIIRASATDVLYAKVSGISNLDTADAADTWTVDFTSVRFADALGATVSEDPGVAVTTFSLETYATAAATEFKVRFGADVLTVNTAHVINAHATEDTDNVDILSFSIEIDGDSDVYLDDLPVNFDCTGATDLDDVFNGLTLLMDGEEVGSSNVAADCIEDADCINVGQDETYLFENMGLWLDHGGYYEFLVQMDLLAFDTAGLDAGDTIAANFGETETDLVASFDAEDEQGDNLADADKTGTATGAASELRDSGIMVEFVSSSAAITHQGDPAGTNDHDQGLFTIRFNVTAFDGNMWLDGTSPTEAGTAEHDLSIAGAETVLGSAITSPTGATQSGTVNADSRFLIVEGGTETFEITVTLAPTADGYFEVAITDLIYALTDVTGDLAYTFNLGAFKTPQLYLNFDT